MENKNFENIYYDFEKTVYNYILRMVKDQDIAQDLTQDTFIKIHQNFNTFRGESSLSTWIYRIATNTYLDYFRSAGHNKSLKTDELQPDNEDELLGDEIDKVLSIDEQVIKTEMNDCIRGFLNNLSDEYRAVIVLHDLQGLKNQEVADVIDVSLDIAKIRLHRARKKFQKVLVNNCDFYKDSESSVSCVKKEIKLNEL